MATLLNPIVSIVQDILNPLTNLMYDKKYPVVNKLLSTIEQKTNIKREKLAYGTVIFFSIYFIVGSLAQIISNVVGFVYPAWCSIKAVRSQIKEDDTQWLIYWIVFSAFSIIDFSVFSAFPFYWLMKVSFLMYLYMPTFRGATVIYETYIEPTCVMLENYFSAELREINKQRKD